MARGVQACGVRLDVSDLNLKDIDDQSKAFHDRLLPYYYYDQASSRGLDGNIKQTTVD
ncbi:hypothetical protein C1H46_001647 [Malus baccata]|uniref:Uncharacterized protein n=1 Tax=Malus baccata TaxID=106549 RepID=A0A540NNZ7_MALBA|nr:hypothetical protein C1H46_001647 [Malus baccata]